MNRLNSSVLAEAVGRINTAPGQAANTIRLKLADEPVRRCLRDQFPFTARVAVSAPPRLVKAVVYDAGSDHIGSIAAQIK